MKKADYSRFLNVKEKFAERLRAGGLEPKIIEDTIDVEKLPAVENGGKGTSSVDFSSVAKKYDVDYVLLLKIKKFGTARKYFAFVPVGSPRTFCIAGGILVEGKTNQEYWAYAMSPAQSGEEIEGEWDNPPDYPELDAAMDKSIDRAIDEVGSNFK